MIELPPQPQVDFSVSRDGRVYESVGHLEFEDGEVYAIPALPVAGRWVIRLDRNRLEHCQGVLGLPYFVHIGPPIPV
jgi:hypothetical protein